MNPVPAVERRVITGRISEDLLAIVFEPCLLVSVGRLYRWVVCVGRSSVSVGRSICRPTESRALSREPGRSPPDVLPRLFHCDQAIPQRSCDRCVYSQSADCFDALRADAQGDVSLQRRNPVPFALKIRFESATCCAVRVGDAVAHGGARSQDLTLFGHI